MNFIRTESNHIKSLLITSGLVEHNYGDIISALFCERLLNFLSSVY